jgi:hypothetical protein
MNLKKFIAFTLILCLQGLSFAQLLADVSFKLNETYIAKVLCVNRAKPKLSCYGKCYRMKMQKQAEETKKTGDNLLKEYQFSPAIFREITGSQLHRLVTACSFAKYPVTALSAGWLHGTFQPPGSWLFDRVSIGC